jgi:hypothetical protein
MLEVKIEFFPPKHHHLAPTSGPRSNSRFYGVLLSSITSRNDTTNGYFWGLPERVLERL